MAYVDESNANSPTVRHKDCAMLVHSGSSSSRCRSCQLFRNTLRALLSRQKQRVEHSSIPSGKMNDRYMSSNQRRAKLVKFRLKHKANRVTIKRLKSKIKSLSERAGIALDESTHNDLRIIMKENGHLMTKHPRNSFAHLFWEQQSKAASMRSANSMRWHPLMVKWCLYLRHLSGKGYDFLRGTLSLPSQRTLRDYTYYNKTQIGFSRATDDELLEKVSKSKEHQRLVSIIIDEIYIREQIVYDKHTGVILGFVDMGDINNHLAK